MPKIKYIKIMKDTQSMVIRYQSGAKKLFSSDKYPIAATKFMLRDDVKAEQSLAWVTYEIKEK